MIQVFFLIYSTLNWYLIHEFLTQANNNDTGVIRLSDILYFNLGLAAFVLLVEIISYFWDPIMGSKKD